MPSTIEMMATHQVPASEWRGSQIGRYQLLEHIATGGMGIIYKALDEETSETVALKILLPALAHHPLSLEQFRREAGRFAKLRHENIINLYEFGEANGICFLALEYVHGIDLHEYISWKGQLEPAEACGLLYQAGQALAYLHEQKIVHRDVKPSNFLVTRPRRNIVVKLIDLGLAREVGDDEMRLTRTGFMVGTVDYMAPEQARDGRLGDFRSDIYSLGCTFYHMLSGRPPFSEGSIPERVIKHTEAEPPNIRMFNPDLPPPLVEVLQRMLAKKPEHRYQNLASVLGDLTAVVPEAARRHETANRNGEAANGLNGDPRLAESRHRRFADSPLGLGIREPRGQEKATENGFADRPASLVRDITAKYRQAALGQFERANQVIAVRGYDYGIHLLLSCCRLDPANLIYRQFLRRLEKTMFRNKLRNSRLSWLTTLPARFLFQASWKAGKYLKVIEYGERILVRDPWDISTQMTMAEAAERLGLPNLAMWILEQAWQRDSHTPELNRALSRLYEKRGHLTQAIALLKLMIRENPSDAEAICRLQNLAAEDTIVRGQYEKIVARRLPLER